MVVGGDDAGAHGLDGATSFIFGGGRADPKVDPFHKGFARLPNGPSGTWGFELSPAYNQEGKDLPMAATVSGRKMYKIDFFQKYLYGPRRPAGKLIDTSGLRLVWGVPERTSGDGVYNHEPANYYVETARQLHNGFSREGEALHMPQHGLQEEGDEGGAQVFAGLPSKICVKVWMADLSTGENNQLQATCASFAQYALPRVPAGPMLTELSTDYSAATALCSDATGKCRANVHLVLWATAGPYPLDSLGASVQFQFDGGDWETGTAMYEQHFDARTALVPASYDADAHLAHAMQADYDRIFPQPRGPRVPPLPGRVCYRVRFYNTVTGENVPLAGGDEGCMAVCHTLHEFAKPYCPGSMT